MVEEDVYKSIITQSKLVIKLSVEWL